MLKARTGHQHHLESALVSIFPGANIVTNTKTLRDPESGALFELDVWLPDYSLAFEYQDAHHYLTTWYSVGSLSQVQSADNRKAELARKERITLVHVPCWPFNIDDLCATINFVRPDLSLKIARKPINFNPPQKFFATLEVPDIGELMLASFYVGSDVSSIISPETSWWMGEKYDGIRCVWNPNQCKLYTRTGGYVSLPDSMENTCQQTSLFLDCELWTGRGTYIDVFRITLPYEVPIDWPFVRIVAFDDATPSASNFTFEKRYERLISSIFAQSPFLIVAARVECNDANFLKNFSHGIFKEGGEGIILRKQNSLYEHGRSSDLYKVKVSRGDTEALVVDILPKGKVKLKLPSGILFEADSEMMRLKIGDVVTFEYNAVSRRELPIKPKIVRVRHDLSWRHVLSGHAQHPAHFSSSITSDVEERGKKNFHTKPKRFWNDKNILEKAKKIFEEFARQRNLDPLVPETWYNINSGTFLREKGANMIYKKFGGYIRSLQAVFPKIGLDVHKFATASFGYWNDIDNRRQQLIQYAKRHNFDPFVAENWAKIYVKQIREEENISWIRMYGGSFYKALLHIFPNIGLKNVPMAVAPEGYWTPATRKIFFDKFAKEQKFDPLISQNWYHADRELLKTQQKYRPVIEKLGIGKALQSAYPDIGIDPLFFAKLGYSKSHQIKSQLYREKHHS